MDEIIGFKDLKVGQQVKAKGKQGGNGTFTAFEISVRPQKEHSSMNGPIQEIDSSKKTLRVLNRDVSVDGEIEFMDEFGDDVEFERLQAGAVVKVKAPTLAQASSRRIVSRPRIPEAIKVRRCKARLRKSILTIKLYTSTVYKSLRMARLLLRVFD
ncbi:DUF5666 domain-containing protein [bacterium]|nr:DUF5666 domain-containing protein [bacterium]